MERDATRSSGDRPARKIGEAPNIGKLLRSPLSGTKPKRGGLSRVGKKRRKQRILLAWSVVFAVVSVGIVMFFVISHFRNLANTPPVETKLGSYTPDLEEIFSQEKNTSITSPGREESMAIVKAALSNRDPARTDDYFALRATTEPDDVIRFLIELEAKEGKVDRLEWIGTIFSNGMLMEQVVAYMETDGQAVNRLAMIFRQPNGNWRVDFDAYIRRSTPDWGTILTRKSETSEVRVFIAPDTYYNGIYSDDKQWQAYALVSPDVKEILYGYVKRDTPAFRAMEKILESEVPIHRATLSILTAPKGGERQFEISRVLSENWVVGNIPYDELF